MLFLQGVELEQNGDLFEAIQKYRKAVALVPDIEFRSYKHNLLRRNLPNENQNRKFSSVTLLMQRKINLWKHDDSW